MSLDLGMPWPKIPHLKYPWYVYNTAIYIPDSKVYGANIGPTWGQQDPGGPYVDPMNFAIWDIQYVANTGRVVTLIMILKSSDWLFQGNNISINLIITTVMHAKYRHLVLYRWKYSSKHK